MVAEVGEKVRFMVHENWRFRPQYRTAGRWIHEGKVGAIREFRLSTHSSGLVSAVPGETPFALKRQPFFADLPRFIILELLIHHLDTARFLIGPLTVSWAVTRRVCPLVIGEDLALIALNAENGAVGTVSGNLSAPGFPPLPQDRLELIGDKGNILFDANRLRLQGEISENLEIDLEAAYQASYDNAVSHFVDSLRGDRPFETDRLDNLETLRLVEAAYRMAKTPGN
jgi:predicted dehydrogenase